ncbi:hypothetical protein D1007_54941 [Hordeum vulgare]|nr:hypothetical protein D1007_54941 [Hordeum vulgare]
MLHRIPPQPASRPVSALLDPIPAAASTLPGPARRRSPHPPRPRIPIGIQVMDMDMEEVDLLIEGEDDVLRVLAIHLEITGVVRDHEVIGIEPMFHHPLALEDFLLHSFKHVLRGFSPLRSLHIMDVQHPIAHLDSLRVLHHFPQIWVDDVVEEFVLGGS